MLAQGLFGIPMTKEFANPRSLGGASRRDEALSGAIFALNSQRPQDAERIARDVLKAEPRHAQALHVLGHALLMQGRADDAIAAIEPAARGLHDPALDTQLAVALRQSGRTEDALSRLKRATKRQPPFAPAFHELGALLFSIKRYEESVEALQRGLEAAPAMPELSIQLGYVFLEMREPAKAKTAFAKALEIAPSAAGALWGIGKAHQQLGENQPAIDYFRRVLSQMPNDAGTWLNLGHSLVEAGDLDAGYECFRTAARGDQKKYYSALTTLVKSGRGRFWLWPREASRFLQGEKN
jgi:tetratricopeptide (TPR) repeat protein